MVVQLIISHPGITLAAAATAAIGKYDVKDLIVVADEMSLHAFLDEVW